jgi:TnpA family transposase
MPVSFLTANERERLQSVPQEIPSEHITAFFTLSETDMVLVQKQHGDYNRLGFALQLCLLRSLGFSPQNLLRLPENVVAYVARQLHVNPGGLSKYGKRSPTRTVAFQAIQAYLGFRKATTNDFLRLSRWLLERALEHDKPSLLLQFLCEKLYQEKNCPARHYPFGETGSNCQVSGTGRNVSTGSSAVNS